MAREVVVTTDVVEPEFLAEMAEVVEVTVATSTNGYGEPAFSPSTARAIEVPARVVRKIRQVRSRDGKMVASSFQVILAAVGLATDDRISLPDTTPQDRPVVSVEEYRTDGGIRHHSTLYYQ